jgi:hypothetical protein
LGEQRLRESEARLPWADNRVTLAVEKDQFGLPVAKVTFSLHENELSNWINTMKILAITFGSILIAGLQVLTLNRRIDLRKIKRLSTRLLAAAKWK